MAAAISSTDGSLDKAIRTFLAAAILLATSTWREPLSRAGSGAGSALSEGTVGVTTASLTGGSEAGSVFVGSADGDG